MASTDTGIYGNPFSYIKTNNVKEPRTSKSSDNGHDSDPEENKQPFSYLNNAPSATVLRSASDVNRPRTEDNVFYDRNSNSKDEKKLDYDSLYRPPPANHFVASNSQLYQQQQPNNQPLPNGQYQSSTLPIQHTAETSYTELGHIKGVDNGMYYSGEYNNSMQRANHNPEKKGLPRIYVSGQPFDDPSGAPSPPESPTQSPRGVRPSTRDSAMGESYRSKNSSSYEPTKTKTYVTCFCVVLVIIVGLVALVTGFLAGWFLQAMMMNQAADSTTTVPVTMNPSTNTPPTTASTSTTTTLPPTTITNNQTTTQAPITTATGTTASSLNVTTS